MSSNHAGDTVIFLFRDLITEPNQTINLHAQKIHDCGSCWWAWWKKAIEDVPRRLLTELVGLGPADVFLFDCGAHEIYLAKLTEVEISPSDEPIRSPNVTFTPDYYVDRRFVTWLRLGKISKVRDKDDLFKHLRYTGFPSWRQPIYDEYLGRHVKDTVELDGMIVTMWQVRTEDGFTSKLTELEEPTAW